MTTVAVCIATYKRPRFLACLLESLNNQQFHKQQNIQIKIIVVDNDSDGGAGKVAEDWAAKLKWPLIYAIEPKRGIPCVRNRLVSLSKGMDFIAFIDDDETAHSNWLDELVSAQKTYQADVVAGPVLPSFKCALPQWAIQGRFFERRRLLTGEKIYSFATGNVLIIYELLEKLKGPFDEELTLTGGGGEDYLLSINLKELEAKMVWADEAIVEEYVPKSRMTVKWLCQRAFRGGNSYNLAIKKMDTSKKFILKRLVQGFGRIVQGLILLILSIFMSNKFKIKALIYVFLGMGNLAGLLNYKYQEYKKIHGN